MTLYYLLRCSGLIILGLLIYAQTFQFDFVFDDHIFIVTNSLIKNFSNIPVIWHAFPMTRFIGLYTFALNYHYNQLHPQGYHVFNFIVHMAAVGMVWALADLLFKIVHWLPSKDRLIRELPFLIAVLFLVHPCQTQAVTYITQRFESMATLFYLLTVYMYLRARQSTGRMTQKVLFALTGFFAVLGILTKEVVITVPAMLLACEWILFPEKNNKRTYITLLLAGFVLFILFVKITHYGVGILLQSYPSESHDGDVLTPARYLLTQMRVFLTFLRLLVLPIHQNLDYDYPASSGFLHPPMTLLGLCVILGLAYLTVKIRYRAPLIAFGLAWTMITFFINLVPRSNVIFEHKFYLISFGYFLAMVAALAVLVRNRGTLLRILCCMIALFAFLSFIRNKVWANELFLWEDSIKVSPGKARVNGSLGRVYGTLGRYDEAVYYLSRSIALKPDNIAYENRGIIYFQLGKSAQAFDDLNKAIAMEPNYFIPYVKRSWVNQTEHNYKAALSDLARAIELNPYFVDAYIERGMLKMKMGNPQEAFQDFQLALKIDPFNYDVLMKQGAAYLSLERYDPALENFTKALRLEPASTEAAKFRSICLMKMGR